MIDNRIGLNIELQQGAGSIRMRRSGTRNRIEHWKPSKRFVLVEDALVNHTISRKPGKRCKQNPGDALIHRIPNGQAIVVTAFNVPVRANFKFDGIG